MDTCEKRAEVVRLLSEVIRLLDSIDLRIEAAHVSTALERLREASPASPARAERTIST